MPVSGGGFEQSCNAQSGVDTQTMLVVTAHVSQACNDKCEIKPTMKAIEALPQVLRQVQTLIADNGYCSQANAQACAEANIQALLALKRQTHHLPVMERFAPDAPESEKPTAMQRMAHELSTQAGRALYALSKQTAESVFGIIKHVMGWRQMSMRGLDNAQDEWSLVTMAWNIKRMHVLRGA
jgi:hypothetical protein